MAQKITAVQVRKYVLSIVGEDVHAKRVESLSNATLGVFTSASLAVHAIGQGLAAARGLTPKHAIKQVDRLLSNGKLQVWEYFGYWVPYVIGSRQEILVALDWTDFDADGQTTIALNLLTSHGRATPLVWKTVKKSELKDCRALYEDEVLFRLKAVLPADVKVTVVADRGFFDTQLLEVLRDKLHFGYLIRMKSNIWVRDRQGNWRYSAEWVGEGGKTRTLREATVTKSAQFPVPTVVCTWDRAMKEPWCLVASDAQASGSALVRLYAKRWGIETYFRDAKDQRFGLGLKAVRTKSTLRRDRLLLLAAFAIVLMTLLGAAGESLGYDRLLKANTVQRRTHSLFRQGWMLYELLPEMPAQRLRPLMKRFGEMLLEQPAFEKVFAVI